MTTQLKALSHPNNEAIIFYNTNLQLEQHRGTKWIYSYVIATFLHLAASSPQGGDIYLLVFNEPTAGFPHFKVFRQVAPARQSTRSDARPETKKGRKIYYKKKQIWEGGRKAKCDGWLIVGRPWIN